MPPTSEPIHPQAPQFHAALDAPCVNSVRQRGHRSAGEYLKPKADVGAFATVDRPPRSD